MNLTSQLLRINRRNRSVWRRRFDAITDRLVASHGLPRLGNFRDPVKEIFYIMLSAKTTDAQYRRTYRQLNQKFGSLEALAAASIRSIRPCIESGGLGRKRATHVRGAARALIALGTNPSRVLKSMDAAQAFELIAALPGMGPKSALCVLMYSMRYDAFPVDANVQRIAERVGAIPRGLNHYQSQRRLAPLVPEGRSLALHVSMVVHGRTICTPMKPKCENCSIAGLCSYPQRKQHKGVC